MAKVDSQRSCILTRQLSTTRPDKALIDKLPGLPEPQIVNQTISESASTNQFLEFPEPEIIDKTIIEQVPLIESIPDLVGKIDTEQSSANKSASMLLQKRLLISQCLGLN